MDLFAADQPIRIKYIQNSAELCMHSGIVVKYLSVSRNACRGLCAH